MRYIKIPETLLPISDDFPVGQNVNLRIGVNIEGPTRSGYFGLVVSTEAIPTDMLLSEDVSEYDLS